MSKKKTRHILAGRDSDGKVILIDLVKGTFTWCSTDFQYSMKALEASKIKPATFTIKHLLGFAYD